MSLTPLPDTQRYASLIAAMELAKDPGFTEPFASGKDGLHPFAPLHCLKSLDDLDEEADSVEDDDEEDLEDEDEEDDDEEDDDEELDEDLDEDDDDEEDDEDDDEDEDEDEEEDGGVKPLKMGSL